MLAVLDDDDGALGGEEIGGMWDTSSPNMPPNTPPCIGLMIRVESADAVSAKANELGGLGKPAFDVGPTGRMRPSIRSRPRWMSGRPGCRRG